MLFAMTAVASLSGKSCRQGMLSTILGLMIATGRHRSPERPSRYTSASRNSRTASFHRRCRGLFAVAEVFRGLEELYRGTAPPIIRNFREVMADPGGMEALRGAHLARRDHRLHHRGAAGGGGHHRLDLSYSARSGFQTPRGIRQGGIEGVAGPESANNSDTAGAMVPLLTLRCAAAAPRRSCWAPSSCTASNRPTLFQTRPDLVWGLVDSMYVATSCSSFSTALIACSLRMLYIPRGILYPLIMAISAIGVYSSTAACSTFTDAAFRHRRYVFDKCDTPSRRWCFPWCWGA